MKLDFIDICIYADIIIILIYMYNLLLLLILVENRVHNTRL